MVIPRAPSVDKNFKLRSGEHAESVGRVSQERPRVREAGIAASPSLRRRSGGDSNRFKDGASDGFVFDGSKQSPDTGPLLALTIFATSETLRAVQERRASLAAPPLASRGARGVYWLLVGALAGGFFAFRLLAFAETEPWGDQAVFSRWVQDLYLAEHTLPDSSVGGSWRSALEGDEGSFVHHLAIRIYNRTHSAFNLVPLVVYFGSAIILGGSHYLYIASSILGSVCLLLAIGSFPFWIRPEQRPEAQASDTSFLTVRRDAVIGLFGAFLAGSALYLHHFSPFGIHNFGLAALVAAVGVCTRLVTSPAPATVVAAAIATLASIYTNWTNLLLLPCAMVMTLVMTREWQFEDRVRSGLGYAAIVTLGVLPVAVIAIGLDFAQGDLVHLGSDDPSATGLDGMVERMGSWFSAGATLFSGPGLVLGLAGVVLAYRVQRIRLPAMLLVLHYLLWVAFAGIADKWLRTYLYVLPFLALGAANALVLTLEGLRNAAPPSSLRLLWPAAAGLLTCWHFALQLPPLFSDDSARARLPEFWEWYRQGQGNLSPIISDIQAKIPQGSVLFTLRNPIQDTYAVMADPGHRVEIPPALVNLWKRHRNNNLIQYLQRRNVSIPPAAPLFLLASQAAPHSALTEAVGDVLADGLGLADAYSVVLLQSWETNVAAFGSVSLYQISPVTPDARDIGR